MSIEHIIEEVPPEGLTVDAIRKVHEAFMFYFNAGGGVMDYEVQCIGALLAHITKLEGDAESTDEMLAQLRGFADDHKACDKKQSDLTELRPCYSIEGLTAFIAKHHPAYELRER